MYGQPTVRDEMLPNVTGVNKLLLSFGYQTVESTSGSWGM